MSARRALGRTTFALAVAVGLTGLQGCANYMRYRGDDAREMIDIGITSSTKPYYAVYGCAVGVASVGAGRFYGTFDGLGGGVNAKRPLYYRNIGLLLWSYEEIGWGDYDVTKPETLEIFYPGLLGYILHLPRRPSYAPACNHFIHLGRGGVVLNLRYLEILDFLLGWTTLDICGDDGREIGHWPWQQDGARNMPRRLNLSR